MAQYFFDVGFSAPTLRVSDVVDHPIRISGLLLRKARTETDLSRVVLDRVYDVGVEKYCLGLVPDYNGIEETDYASTSVLLTTEFNVSDFEALIKFRSMKAPKAYTGANNFYSGGAGIIFRATGEDIVSGGSIDLSQGGAVFAGGTLSSETNGIGTLIRAYSANYYSSNVATTSSRYLPSPQPGDRNNLFFNLKVQVEGTNIKARSWREDQTEPSAWGINLTRSDLPLYGRVGIIADSWLEGRVIDFFSIGTDGDPAPSAPPELRTVTGLVRDPSGSAVGEGYLVRCYLRENGVLLDETKTNASGVYQFQLPVPKDELLHVTAIDNIGNLWGSPAVDRVGGDSGSPV